MTKRLLLSAGRWPAPAACGKAAAPRLHLRCACQTAVPFCTSACAGLQHLFRSRAHRGCVHRLLWQLQVVHMRAQLSTSTRLGYVCIGMQPHLCPQHLCSLAWLAAAHTAGVAIAIPRPVHGVEELHRLGSVELAACR